MLQSYQTWIDLNELGSISARDVNFQVVIFATSGNDQATAFSDFTFEATSTTAHQIGPCSESANSSLLNTPEWRAAID